MSTDPNGEATATNAEGQRPTSTTLYFVLALAITNVALAPAILAYLGVLEGSPLDHMAGAPIAIFGPTIAAVIASRREGGGAEVRRLFSGLRAWHVAPYWFVVALTLPALAGLVGRVIYSALPGSEPVDWLYPPGDAQRVIGAILVPIGEEIGWRGYALPRLVARHGPVRASVILGLLWALWHTGMLLGVSMPLPLLALMPVFFVAGSFLFTWLHQRTGGSLLLAVLLHVGAHLDNTQQYSALTPSVLAVGSMVVLAVLLVALDPVAFGRGGAPAGSSSQHRSPPA